MEISPTAIVWMSVPIATIEPLYMDNIQGFLNWNKFIHLKISYNFECLVKEFFNLEAWYLKSLQNFILYLATDTDMADPESFWIKSIWDMS